MIAAQVVFGFIVLALVFWILRNLFKTLTKADEVYSNEEINGFFIKASQFEQFFLERELRKMELYYQIKPNLSKDNELVDIDFYINCTKSEYEYLIDFLNTTENGK